MRRALASAVVAFAACRGLPVTAAVSELDRQRLVAHLDMTAGWLVDEVSGLTAAQIDFRPAPEAWSIAQVVEHLVVVAPIYWQDLQTALKQPPSDRRSAMTDADVLWYGIDRTRREQAVPTERPTGQPHDLRAALAAYRKYHDRLRHYITTTGDDLRSHLVQRQGCDAYQWALLISTHEQRHVLQIREIKMDPRFPKKYVAEAREGARIPDHGETRNTEHTGAAAVGSPRSPCFRVCVLISVGALPGGLH